MIQQATKYGNVRAAGRNGRLPASPREPRTRAPGKLNILVPKAGSLVDLPEWAWKELREGGYLHTYLMREKAREQDRARAVARRMDGVKPNPKTDVRLVASVPARDFFRLTRSVPDFFADDWNLRYLRRRGAEFPIFV